MKTTSCTSVNDMLLITLLDVVPEPSAIMATLVAHLLCAAKIAVAFMVVAKVVVDNVGIGAR